MLYAIWICCTLKRRIKMADISELIIKIDSDGVVRATGNLEVFSKAAEDAAKSTDKTKSSAKSLITTLENQVAVLGMNARELAIFKAQTKKATDEDLKRINALHDEIDAYQQKILAEKQAGKELGNLSKATRSNVAPMKDLRSQAQQASYQLQDIAVQAQMGTSWFTIFGQQGSQLASVFGKSGAVYGAVIAFGAILAGALYNSLNKAGDAMKALEEDSKTLTERYDELGEASKAYVRTLVGKSIQQNIILLKQLREEQEAGIKTVQTGNDGRLVAIETEEEYAERMIKVGKDIERTEKKKSELIQSIDNTTNSTESLIKGLKEEAATFGMSARQLALYKIGTDEAQQANRDAVDTLYDQIEAQEKLDESRKANKSYFEGLFNEAAALSLTGDALYEYQARAAGVTKENLHRAVLLARNIALLKEQAEAAKEAEAAKKVSEKYIQSLDDQQAALTLNVEELGRYKAIQAGLTGTALDAAVATYVNIEALKEQAEAQKALDSAAKTEADKKVRDTESAKARLLQIAQDAMNEADLIDSLEAEAIAKEEADRAAGLISLEEFELAKQQIEEKYSKDRVALAIAEAQAKLDIQQQVLSSLGGLAGQMAGIAAEGSKEAKALFAIQKAIAIAQIIVSTEVAAQAAGAQSAILAGPLGYFATAAGIRAVGYASAGLVAGTAIAGGRALGGQVRGGESYLVGERGPELLTMGTSGRIATNENLKKAVGSQGETVQQNVSVNFSIQANDTAGFDRLLNSRRGQIMSMINQAVNDRGRASLA
jgi:hypothetical protein